MPYKRAQAKEKYIPKSKRLMDQVREVYGITTTLIKRKEHILNGFSGLSNSMEPGIQRKWANMKSSVF